MHRSNLQTAKILLEPTPRNATLELFISSPTLSEEYALGKLFLLLHIESIKDRAYELAITIRREVERRYYQGYNLKQDISVEKKFEEALQRLNQTVSEMMAEPHADFTLEGIHFIIGVVHNRELHFTQFGASKAYLIHKIKGKDYRTINILDSVNEKTGTSMAKLFTNIISGEIDTHDALLFATESLVNYLSLDKLRLTIIHHSASEAAAHLHNLLKEINSQMSFGALILKYPSLLVATPREEKRIEMKQPQSDRSLTDLAHAEAQTEEVLSPSLSTRIERYSRTFFYWIQEKIRGIFQKGKTKRFLESPSKENNIYQRLARERSRFRPKDRIIKKTIRIMRDMFMSIFAVFGALGKMISKMFQKRTVIAFSNIPRKLRWVGFSISLLAVLLIVSLSISGKKNQEETQNVQFKNILLLLEEKLTQAEAALIYNDDVRIQGALSESESLLGSLSPKNEGEKKEYSEVAEKLETLANRYRRIEVLPEPPMLFSITSKKEFIQKIGEKMNPERILIVYEGDTLFQYDSSKKTTREFSLSGTPPQFTLTDAQIYSGRLYVFDGEAQEIYRFSQSGNTFVSPSQWVKNGKENLKNGRALTIDGGIYVMTQEKLFRFFNGSFEKEIPLFIDPKLKGPKKIWTSAESDAFYFLDFDSQRIVITTKEGKLQKQFTSPKWNNIQDFIVDEEGMKIYLLNGNEVYEVGF